MKRAAKVGLAVLLVVAMAGVTWLIARSGGGGDEGGAEAADAATTTVAVQRRDLVDRETLEGTLGYEGSTTLLTQATGTLTSLRPEGAVVYRGEPLYRVDDRAVILLYGSTPAWRTLSIGIPDGADVRQLEENLSALGHDPGGDLEVDERFDASTAATVRRWQRAAGHEQDGVVDPRDLALLPGATRIGSHRAGLGATLIPGAEVMDVSGTRRVVTLALEATRQDLLGEGERVEVELPDGRTVPGTVASVGTVAERPSDSSETGGGEASGDEPTVDVTITLGGAAGGFDQAPVDVGVERSRERAALAVPVAALLALAEGGFALEVDEGPRRRLVGVETGVYADGWVQVAGDGIAEGVEVVIPA
ncbi:peptidoglycan-binding protein [soil metagenome]